VKQGTKAVQIDFNSPHSMFDLVYPTKEKFKVESKKINTIRKMRPLHKNSIKLTKYAIDKAGLKDIKSYEVEMACLSFNYNNLAECTDHLIKYFTERIKQKGLKIDDVLKFLN